MLPKSSIMIATVLIWAAVGVGFQTQAQIADFTFSPQDPDVNTEVTLDAGASRSAGGQIVRYEWDFDGDGLFEQYLESPRVVHLFDESGSYTVTLRITDQQGRQATVSKALTVRSAPVTVRREIISPLPPNRVPAGSAFQVTITITVNETINGLGLDEDLPEGWRAGSVEAEGAVFKASSVQWLWFQTLNPGQTLKITYNVTVPRGVPEGTFRLEGIVSSFSPRFEISIPGDDEVRVI